MMVKQKIVIKLTMPCDKSRAKAMAIVSGVSGVISMAITGDLNDRLEVVGEGVDAICLVCCLRKKKLGHVEILLVEEVKDKKKEEKEEKPCCPGYPYYCYCHPIRPPPMVVCEDQANSCSIL